MTFARRPPRPEPTPGHPIVRGGKPWIYVTWLAKLLGGNECVWSAWFKARHRYSKFEEHAEQLADWNRDHSALMRQVRAELDEHGWRCTVEGQNDFSLEGDVAIVAGKPDLEATMPGHFLVVDGKTGRPRESDWWQVAIYLFAKQLQQPALVAANKVSGEIRYTRGPRRTIALRDVTPARRADIATMVKRIAAVEPPPKAPSRHECRYCNIGPQDCPQRFVEHVARETTKVGAF